MAINDKWLEINSIPIPSLPDSDKKNILSNVSVVPSSNQGSVVPAACSQNVGSAPDLATVMLYSELRRRSCTRYTEYKANELIQGILKRKSNILEPKILLQEFFNVTQPIKKRV